MMIALMLMVALMMLALAAALPSIRQQAQRDRELELQHRGTAYMRAIQHFYKKFGRYPTRIEELESSNNLRFLRKRYTDPMNRDPQTGKERDFKLLHQQDVTLNSGPILGQIPGQIPGQIAGQISGQGIQTGGFQQGSSPFQQLQQQSKTVTQASGSDDSSKGGGDNEENPNGTESSGSGASAGSASSSSSSSGFGGQTFGGGPILGVKSLSKAKSVRVFYDKSHYNDWLFIYVPQADRGGLLVGPINPGMPTGNLNGPGQGISGGIVPNQGAGQGLNPGQSQLPTQPPPQTPSQNPPEQ